VLPTRLQHTYTRLPLVTTTVGLRLRTHGCTFVYLYRFTHYVWLLRFAVTFTLRLVARLGRLARLLLHGLRFARWLVYVWLHAHIAFHVYVFAVGCTHAPRSLPAVYTRFTVAFTHTAFVTVTRFTLPARYSLPTPVYLRLRLVYVLARSHVHRYRLRYCLRLGWLPLPLRLRTLLPLPRSFTVVPLRHGYWLVYLYTGLPYVSYGCPYHVTCSSLVAVLLRGYCTRLTYGLHVGYAVCTVARGCTVCGSFTHTLLRAVHTFTGCVALVVHVRTVAHRAAHAHAFTVALRYRFYGCAVRAPHAFGSGWVHAVTVVTCTLDYVTAIPAHLRLHGSYYCRVYGLHTLRFTLVCTPRLHALRTFTYARAFAFGSRLRCRIYAAFAHTFTRVGCATHFYVYVCYWFARFYARLHTTVTVVDARLHVLPVDHVRLGYAFTRYTRSRTLRSGLHATTLPLHCGYRCTHCAHYAHTHGCGYLHVTVAVYGYGLHPVTVTTYVCFACVAVGLLLRGYTLVYVRYRVTGLHAPRLVGYGYCGSVGLRLVYVLVWVAFAVVSLRSTVCTARLVTFGSSLLRVTFIYTPPHHALFTFCYGLRVCTLHTGLVRYALFGWFTVTHGTLRLFTRFVTVCTLVALHAPLHTTGYGCVLRYVCSHVPVYTTTFVAFRYRLRFTVTHTHVTTPPVPRSAVGFFTFTHPAVWFTFVTCHRLLVTVGLRLHYHYLRLDYTRLHYTRFAVTGYSAFVGLVRLGSAVGWLLRLPVAPVYALRVWLLLHAVYTLHVAVTVTLPCGLLRGWLLRCCCGCTPRLVCGLHGFGLHVAFTDRLDFARCTVPLRYVTLPVTHRLRGYVGSTRLPRLPLRLVTYTTAPHGYAFYPFVTALFTHRTHLPHTRLLHRTHFTLPRYRVTPRLRGYLLHT